MKLSNTAVRKAKPGFNPITQKETTNSYKISDGDGMYLEVMPTGSRYWRLKYRYAGKEKRLAFGVYPDVSLTQARSRRDDVRKLLANGTNTKVSIYSDLYIHTWKCGSMRPKSASPFS